MSGGHEKVSLGSICDFKNGRSFNKTEWSMEGLPIIRIQNLNNPNALFNYFKGEYDSRIEINDGDLLFSWSGTIGSSFGAYLWGRGKGVLNQHIYKVNLSKEVDRRYAYHALQWITAEVEKQVNGAVGLVHITKAKLNNFQIPLPPLPVQKRIVAILDEAFAGIGQAIANTERNLKNARELFESYLNDVFTRKGEGWIENTLIEVCNKIQDGAHSSPQALYSNSGPNLFPYLTSKNIRTGYLKLDTIQYCDAKFHDEIYPRCNPELGDVLLTKDGANTGNVAINTLDVPYSLLSSVCLLKPNRSKLVPQFLAYYLRSKEGFGQMTGQMTGTAIKRIILKTIKSSVIPLPTVGQQESIVQKLEDLITQTGHLEAIYQQKLKALAELKQSILQKAFTGELTDNLPL